MAGRTDKRMPRLGLVCPIIREDYVYKAVETLYKYTDNFSLIIVDQTIDGLKEPIKADMVIRMKNQGFAKACNEGMIHFLRWGYPYIGCMNDDIEFIDPKWFEGILEEFATDERIMAVNPESPRVPLWGYGRPHEEYIDIVEYKEHYTPEDIAFLKSGDYERLLERYPLEPYEIADKLPDGKADWKGKTYVPCEKRPGQPNQGQAIFPLTKRGVIDGFAAWLPIFKRESLIQLGMFDERFVWGGGEDYDMMARAYSCAWPIERDECDERYHNRMVSSMKSWVWHWFGKSKDVKGELDPRLFEEKAAWNDLHFLWPPEKNGGKEIDPWGHWDDNGIRRPFKRIPEVKVDPL